LKIRSFGSVTLSNLTIVDNGGDGMFIENGIANGNLIDSVGTLTFGGYAVFQGNIGDGLEAKSNGNMTFANVTANNNGGQGLSLTALKPGVGVANVTITGLNSFSDNLDTGLDIDADGKVTIYNVTANDNVNNGVRISNTAAGMGVYIYGTNRFNRNGTNGLFVDSNGVIVIYNVTANENSDTGATLANDVDPLKPYNVVVTGSSAFNSNGTDGLEVTSFGAILASNLTANNNGTAVGVNGRGISLDNCLWDGAACDVVTLKPITLSGYLRTSENEEDGVYVSSLGAVTFSNILANGNGASGVVVDNSHDPLKQQNVTIKGVNFFNNNTASGLFVESYGIITTYNLTAIENGDHGAYLNNCLGAGAGFACTAPVVKGITLQGVNSFLGNFDNGLYFDASGSVALVRVTAEENGDSAGEDGIKGYAGGYLTLICANTINNGFGSGYDLTADSALYIKGYYSNFNGALDGEVYATLLTKTKPCTLP
jgi:hypothetical protein